MRGSAVDMRAELNLSGKVRNGETSKTCTRGRLITLNGNEVAARAA